MKEFDWAPNLRANTKSMLRGRPWEAKKRDLKAFKSVWDTGYTSKPEEAVDPVHAQRAAQTKANALNEQSPPSRRVFRSRSGQNSPFYRGL
jgi:hypothetical protein